MLAERRSDGSDVSAAGGDGEVDRGMKTDHRPAREDLPPDPITGAFQAARAPRRCTAVPLVSSKISSARRRNFQVGRQRQQQHHSVCVCACKPLRRRNGEEGMADYPTVGPRGSTSSARAGAGL